MFVFTSVHFCQKPNIDMDKLGHFGLGLVMSLLIKRSSLFDVRFLTYVLGAVCCQHIHQSQKQNVLKGWK